MLIENEKWPLLLSLLALLTSNFTNASTLCDGTENYAISSTTPTTDFIDNGDGTVFHKTTGLIWQRCSLGQIWDVNQCTGKPTDYPWVEVLQQAELNTFTGVNDWRVPNKKELASIVEYRCHAPAINNQIFPATPSAWYWSSSPYATYSGSHAWLVDFGYGSVGSYGKYEGGRVRLVRAGQ
ncbi:DUF1566 domain-containing protein [Vibrio cholerae]|nr:DUF1566 domain-containing protein [Vibrio cholerae]